MKEAAREDRRLDRLEAQAARAAQAEVEPVETTPASRHDPAR
jgi:hypothetical protein